MNDIKRIGTGLREIIPKNKADVQTISNMHLDLLRWGPMARMGKLFLERFCYTVLINDGLMKAAIYEVDKKPAGFIAYTQFSITFHRTALKKHFFYVVYIMTISILRKPVLALNVMKAIKVILSRRGESKIHTDPLAEILAIGVYPEFRTPQFIRRTGLKISHELFKNSVAFFKSVGIINMRLAVDSFNKPTLLFYHGLGGRTESLKRGGDNMIQFWFDFEHDY